MTAPWQAAFTLTVLAMLGVFALAMTGEIGGDAALGFLAGAATPPTAAAVATVARNRGA